MELLEQIIGKYLCDLGIGKDFLECKKALTIKEKRLKVQSFNYQD